MLKIWRNRWIRLLLALIGIVCFVKIIPVLFYLYIFSQRLTPLSTVENYIGIKVPQIASDVHYSYEEWQGTSTYLRFSVTDKEASTYIANLEQGKECSYNSPEDNYSPPFSGGDLDWFNPSLVQKYAGQECTSGPKVYYLLLDKTNLSLETIYLFTGQA